MGRHLGSFGKAKTARDDTFDFFGQTIRVHPHLSDVTLLDFMRKAKGIELPDPDDESATLAAMAEHLPMIEEMLTFEVHPDDLDLFWATARANGQDARDLMEIAHGILAAAVDRPTGRPSGSSTGRQHTKATSGVPSSLRVKRRLEKRGRPDLALMVLEAGEARAASA